MPVRRLNHAVLYVRDLVHTVSFYRETLGFELRTEVPGRAAFLRAPGSANDHDLGLFEVAGVALAAGQSVIQAGLYHLAWEVGTLADLADVREKLAAAGAELSQGAPIVPLDLDAELARWGGRRVTGAAAGSAT
jgi:catechol 2,3-dioxygenase-like lactoylglutathione lyase family enzyme